MSQQDALIKFIEVLEKVSKSKITKKGISLLEKSVEEFYNSVKEVHRDKVQSNAMKLLGNNISSITSQVLSEDDFNDKFHRICQLSTEYFDESNDPMMLIAYIGIMSEYYLKKNITHEEQ